MSRGRSWWMVCAVLSVAVVLAVPAAASAKFRVGPNVQVTSEPHNQREPAMTVNPGDDRNLIVAANDGRITIPGCRIFPQILDSCTWVGVFDSRDGGKSWRSQLIPGYPGGPRGTLSEFNMGYDPVVGFDGQGTAYAGGIFANINEACPFPACPNLNTSVAIARSDDGGRTWHEPVIVARGQGTTVVNDHPTMAVDTTQDSDHGNVYVAWTTNNALGENINVMATSRDRGITWSTVQVSSPHPSGNPSSAVFDPMPAVGPNGKVFLTFDEDLFNNAGVTTSETILMVGSQDGGRTFGNPRLVEPGLVPDPLRGFSIPVLAIDAQGAHRGRIYVTWIDGSSGNGVVLLKQSDNGGATWSASVRVNNDTGATEHSNPWISVAPNGRVDIAFYDRRDDPNNVLDARYYAGSTDGGLTFTNVRVSNASWDPTRFPLFPFVGLFGDDYDQIVSTAYAAHLVWADGRNAGPGGANIDVYTATVFASGGNGPQD